MKLDRRYINDACVAYYDAAMYECEQMLRAPDKPLPWKRLRSCRAQVLETPGFFILKSYNTVVAVIDKYTASTWDVLRMAYGYTATSAQHVAKFAADYGNGKRYTWREISPR